MNDLKIEKDTYFKILHSLLADEGKFAVIHSDNLIGIFVAYEDALKIGYEKCGIDKPFLVKRISAEEKVSYFSRDLNMSCPV